MAKKGGVGKRATGGSSNTRRSHKQHLRAGFETRHLDQVWDDVRSQVTVVTTDADGVRTGPVGTTAKATLDEDTPAGGRFYCTPCSKYFISALALDKHTQAKPHKRRAAALGPGTRRPHRQADADAAAGMAPPDNGDAGRRRAAAAASRGAATEATVVASAVVEGGLAGMAL